MLPLTPQLGQPEGRPGDGQSNQNDAFRLASALRTKRQSVNQRWRQHPRDRARPPAYGVYERNSAS